MKAGVAAMLAAAAAVRASGVRLARPFALHLVIGEEDGGLGAFATLQRGHRGDACVIPEPTDLRLVTANAGALSFRIEVPGLATHGSTRTRALGPGLLSGDPRRSAGSATPPQPLTPSR